MRLLHVVFVAGFEHPAFSLLIMEKPQLDLDIHWVFKLLDPLLHRSKVAREIILGLLFDEGKNDGQLIEEVIHCV